MSEYKSVKTEVTGNCYSLINGRVSQAERRVTVKAANLVWLRVHNDVSNATHPLLEVGLRWSTIRELTDE